MEAESYDDLSGELLMDPIVKAAADEYREISSLIDKRMSEIAQSLIDGGCALDQEAFRALYDNLWRLYE